MSTVPEITARLREIAQRLRDPEVPDSEAERLAREAASRPPATPRVEDVLTALARAGLAPGRPQQVLARTLGASFCASAATAQGTGVAVCEFSSEEVARRGLAFSRLAFDRIIPGRTLTLNRKTLLTVTRAEASPNAEAEARAAVAAFARL